MGRVAADSPDKAREKVQAAGLVVASIEPEESSVLVKSAQATSATVSRASPIRQQLMFDKLGIEFFDEVVQPRAVPWLILVTVVGLVAAGYWAWTRKAPPSHSLPPIAYHKVQTQISGRVQLRDQKPLAPLQIEVQFPGQEFCLQKNFEEVADPSGSGNYSLNVEVNLPVVPQQCLVTYRKAGYQGLSTSATAFSNKIDFPAVVLEPLTQPPATPIPTRRQLIAPKPIIQMKPRPK